METHIACLFTWLWGSIEFQVNHFKLNDSSYTIKCRTWKWHNVKQSGAADDFGWLGMREEQNTETHEQMKNWLLFPSPLDVFFQIFNVIFFIIDYFWQHYSKTFFYYATKALCFCYPFEIKFEIIFGNVTVGRKLSGKFVHIYSRFLHSWTSVNPFRKKRFQVRIFLFRQRIYFQFRL